MKSIQADKKQERWDDEKEYFSHRADGNNMPIDANILDSVVVLNLLGIKTYMSCGGHDNRVTEGPYIMFHNPERNGLWERYDEIKDLPRSERKELVVKSEILNLPQIQLMMALLDEFYRDRLVPFGDRLILSPIYGGSGRLQCQSSDLEDAIAVNQPERRLQMLRAHQGEMKDFTTFLIQKYFYQDAQ